MLRSGILGETTEVLEWCSQSFPIRKANSNPIKCRWVTDFRNLNMSLKRTSWGGESSSQLLRRINPKSKVCMCSNAILGYHGSELMRRASDFLISSHRYRYTILGQGICSSHDLFFYVTDEKH